MRDFIKNLKGAAMLPMAVMLGGVIIEAVVVLSFMAYTVSQAGLGEKLSIEAYAAARSGAIDAIRKITRDKNYYDSSGSSFENGDRTATVTVVKDYPTSGITRITSVGTALFRQRKIQVDLQVNSITGEASVISFDEMDL